MACVAAVTAAAAAAAEEEPSLEALEPPRPSPCPEVGTGICEAPSGKPGLLVRVLGSRGQVVLQRVLGLDCTALSLKDEIARADGTPALEQLLSRTGLPLRDRQVLNQLLSAEPGPVDLPAGAVGQLELSVRRVDRDWPRLLEDLAAGTESFVEASVRLRIDAQTSQSLSHQRLSRLKQLVQDMGKLFEASLHSVVKSSAGLLSVSGDIQRNRDTVFEVVPRSSKGCRKAAEELMNCRRNVLEAVQSNGKVLLLVQEEMGPPYKAVMKGLQECASGLAESREVFRRHHELLLFGQARVTFHEESVQNLTKTLSAAPRVIARSGEELEALAESLGTSRQAYRRAMVANRNAIRNAEASLRRDQEVIFCWASDHVSDQRKEDRNFMMTIVEGNGEALERAPEHFKRDRGVVLAAVHQSEGWALQFAAEELRRDREIVLAAVRGNGWALEHASENLRGDREVVLTAVQANGAALDFASEALRGDREVVLTAVRRSGGWAFKSASAGLRADTEVATAAVRENSLLLEHVEEALRDSSELVLPALQANGLALEFCSERVRQDQRAVLTAVFSSPHALRFAAPELRGSREVVLAAVEKDGFALRHASDAIRADRDVVLFAIAVGGPGVVECATAAMRRDPLVNQAVGSKIRSSRKPAEPADDSPPPVPGGLSSRALPQALPGSWSVAHEGPDFVRL